MYEHHKQSIEKMKEYYRKWPEAIALFLTGSVANHNERIDSDLDGVVIVTEEFYQKKKKEMRLEETVFGECTYEGGYFDVKYMTKEKLQGIAENGSETFRCLFLHAQTLFTDDPELPEIVAKIGIYPEKNYHEHFLRYYGTMKLAYNYYWCNCKASGYMRYHVADQIVYHLYRLILLENKIFLPCCRRLEQCVIDAPNKPDQIVELCERFLSERKDEDAAEIIRKYEEWTNMKLPEDYGEVVNNHIDPYESF